MRHWVVGALCVVGAGVTFSLPFMAQRHTKNLERKEGSLTGSQRQRGMYMNAGSSDAGVDPDWDPVERKWKGTERRQREQQERLDRVKKEKDAGSP